MIGLKALVDVVGDVLQTLRDCPKALDLMINVTVEGFGVIAAARDAIFSPVPYSVRKVNGQKGRKVVVRA
jgi:hypothetical protein